MSNLKAGIIMLSTHEAAEAAIKELELAGFDMKKLSIVGKDFHTEEHVIGFYNAGDRMSYWGKQGAFWGGLWGILFGSAFFLVPGFGPLIVAGPLVAAIVAGLEGSVIVGGLSILGAALVSIGIPEDSILKYETALESQQFLLAVHGSSEDISHANAILENLNQNSEIPV